jgi:hypothetical protein
MSHLFLKASGRQILLLLGLPLGVQAFIILCLQQAWMGIVFKDVMIPLFVCTAIIITILLSWLWSISIGLQKYMVPELRIKTTGFKTLFFIPIFYLPFFMYFIATHLSTGHKGSTDPYIGVWLSILIPFHILTSISLLNSLYFTAKVYKTALHKKKVTFNDFSLLFAGNPVAIPTIQANLNKWVQEGLNNKVPSSYPTP